MGLDYIDIRERQTFDIRREQSERLTNRESTNTFLDLCREVKEHITKFYEDKIDEEQTEETSNVNFTSIFNNALKGDPVAKRLTTKTINDYINEFGYQDVSFPYYYDELDEAVFEEIYGIGPLSLIRKEKSCEAVQNINTTVYKKTNGRWEKCDAKFRDEEHVEEVYKRIANMDEQLHLDPYNNNKLEMTTMDKIRISIMIPHRVIKPVITLRRKVYEYMSFEEQAKLNTIPDSEDAVNFFKLLSRFNLKGVISGPPASGKNTFLLSMMGEFVYDQPVTMYVESTQEFDIYDNFGDAQIIHAVGTDLETMLGAAQLRHDTRNVVLAEMRENETGFYARSTEQGIKKVISTLHNENPQNLPNLLARLYVIHHDKDMSLETEEKRFAEILNYSIIMGEMPNGEKKVLSVQFHSVENEKHCIYQVLSYDANKNKWTFYNKLPDSIIQILDKDQKHELDLLKTTLEKLSL